MSLLEASVPAFCLASGRRIELTHPMVMGVINVSPNSFFAASKIARFYLDNGAHLLDPIPHYTLLKRAILSLPNAESKNLVLLKLYFEFSRKEGLPVREAWLRNLPSDCRRLAESWLSLPVKEVSADDESLNDILDSLRNWMNGETELQV